MSDAKQVGDGWSIVSLITVCGAKLVIFRVTAKQLVSYLLPGVAAGAALVSLSGSYYCAGKFVMH